MSDPSYCYIEIFGGYIPTQELYDEVQGAITGTFTDPSQATVNLQNTMSPADLSSVWCQRIINEINASGDACGGDYYVITLD